MISVDDFYRCYLYIVHFHLKHITQLTKFQSHTNYRGSNKLQPKKTAQKFIFLIIITSLRMD